MPATQLSEEIGMYVDKLRADLPAVDEVWLIGERANGSADPDAVWELVVFADPGTLKTLRDSPDRHRSDVVMMVVVDGERYATAWGDKIEGRLGEMGWRLVDPQRATYRVPPDGEPAGEGPFEAIRVR